ncbi:hypothetical protein DPMN_062471 [Dreissena polymorpha]|uniref:Steroid 5-alpha reductase C-terminal domain-containing protein n=2 Tax=Dreissena polymorpha TaxID=45954 RepID=A0A9D4C9A5_DREPO|nr:hypothetical protein DPMN_062471 [Dreissena polymorpha]
MGNTFAKAAAIDFGIQWSLWAIASLLKTEKFYDLAGSGTFLFLAYQTLQWGQTYFTRQKVTTGMVMTWAARLGLFLFTRVLKDGKDSRFNSVRGNPGRFWVYWTIQGIWVFVTLLPLLVLNNKKEDRPLTTRDYVGWGIWTLGFLFEALADHQKSVFKSNPGNAGKFITSGLWSVSRYPNYFGEICMWLGIFITSSSVMTTPKEYASVISPLFVSFLLLRVSGIPIQEKQQAKRWGTDPNFVNYVKRTAKLIPYIW